MLFLLFELDGERYALPTSRIAEVLPLVRIKKIPQAPAAIAGLIDYRGAPVPVIDLRQLALGRASQPRLSTRVVLVRYGDRLVGLMIERVAATVRREPTEFVDSGVTNPAAPFLGPVAVDAQGVIQRIEVDQLLPEPLRELPFAQLELVS